MCKKGVVTKLVDGVKAVLQCSKCSNTIVVTLPVYNTNDKPINSFVYEAIIRKGWLSTGDDDDLLCEDCKEEIL